MSLLSSSQITEFSDVFSEHFDTFNYHTLVVWKEPIKNVTLSPPPANYPGYGNTSLDQTVTYQPVSGVFSVMTVKDTDPRFKQFDQTRHNLTKLQTRIKVDQTCRDYIVNGRNELIELDGKIHNLVSDDGDQDYFGIQHYYFVIERTT